MARPMIVNVPPASTTVLYPTSVAGGGATSAIPLAIPYPVQFPNLLRNITFTSTDDLSAINFTITGTDQFGNKITEIVAGPNNDTVSSAKYYNSIYSIASSGNYTNFSIGYGTTGYTTWITTNSMSPYSSYTIQVDVFGTINYSVISTNDPIEYYVPAGPSYKFVYPKPVYLGVDPLTTVNADPTVSVTVPSTAGLKTGDVVTIIGAATTGTITAAQLNITAPITIVDGVTFSYIAGGNGDGTVGGGSNVAYYFPALPTSFALNASLTAATTPQSFSTARALSAIQLVVNSATAPASLTLNLLQQGIR